jgi:hypothetical protein
MVSFSPRKVTEKIGEHDQGDDLLHRLQLGRRIDLVADAVGGHGQAVFEQGDAPADDHHQPQRLEPRTSDGRTRRRS